VDILRRSEVAASASILIIDNVDREAISGLPVHCFEELVVRVCFDCLPNVLDNQFVVELTSGIDKNATLLSLFTDHLAIIIKASEVVFFMDLWDKISLLAAIVVDGLTHLINDALF